MNITSESLGSLFYNNKTQSVRLKIGVKFENPPKRLIALKSKTTDKIYLTNESDENQFLKEFLSIDDVFEDTWKEYFSGRRSVSVFLNNTTQAVRIPSIMAFPSDVPNISIVSYSLENEGKVLELFVS